MLDNAQRVSAKDKLRRFYRDRCDSAEQNAALNTTTTTTTAESSYDEYDIDGPSFNPQVYMNKHLREKDLSDLLLEERVLSDQIRTLDSEMQTLMYDNYSKFISATDTIRMMKSDFKYVGKEMDCLVKNMSSISSLSDSIRNRLSAERAKLKSLANTQQTLDKLRHFVELPGRLRGFIASEKWSEAVGDLEQAKFVLKSYRTTPSFKNIRSDCYHIVLDLQKALWVALEQSPDAAKCQELIDVLKRLGFHSSRLALAFVDCARDKLHAICVNLQMEDKTSTPTSNESQQPSETPSLTFRPDALHFAGRITDSLLDELMTYLTAFTNLFHANNQSEDSDVTDSILDVVCDHRDDDSHDLSPIELENLLADMVQELFGSFLKLVEERFTEEQKFGSDVGLLVRAVERIYSRVQAFTRSYLTAIHAMVGVDHDDSAMHDRSDSTYGVRTKTLCDSFTSMCKDLVQSVAERSTEACLAALCQDTVDCITDLRKQLVNPDLMGPFSATLASQTDGQNKSTSKLTALFNSLNSILVSKLRNALKSQEIFLHADNTFIHRSRFAEYFCLSLLRERLVVGYLEFLTQSFDDMARTAASRVPSPILLLLAKLSITWANSGTIGHLLSIPEEILSRESKPWAHHSSISDATSIAPLTTPNMLVQRFRESCNHLLMAFVRLEGTNLAQLLRKSVEARDWMKNLEPRSVRSVVKRVLEDLNALDQQISQLFSSTARNNSTKDRLSDSRSGRSMTSSLRFNQSASSLYVEHKSSRQPAVASSLAAHQADSLDPSLASQIRRLFTQRIDIYAPVEANRESLLFGVIKIGLKTLVECVRLQTFGKYGLQQIQVDCRYLQIHLWNFVNDEKLVGMLLDDVIYSVVQRCVDAQLMEDSVVDAICDRTS